MCGIVGYTGAKNIAPELLQATIGRRDEFARAGITRA